MHEATDFVHYKNHIIVRQLYNNSTTALNIAYFQFSRFTERGHLVTTRVQVPEYADGSVV